MLDECLLALADTAARVVTRCEVRLLDRRQLDIWGWTELNPEGNHYRGWRGRFYLMSNLAFCVSCGATMETIAGRVDIDEHDIVAIAQLFGGFCDFDRCGACGARQATHPEIRSYNEHGQILARRVISSSTPIVAQVAASYREVASADDLRRIITNSCIPIVCCFTV